MVKATHIRYNALFLSPKDGHVTRIAKKATLTKKQSDALNQIVLSRTHRPDHIERANIILFSSELKQDKDIGQELGIVPRTVRKWRIVKKISRSRLAVFLKSGGDKTA